MRLRFTLAKLIMGSAKKGSRKRKKSNGEVETKKKGTIVSGEVSAFSEGIGMVVSRVSSADPRADVPTERAEVTLIALMDLEVLEMTPTVASSNAPIILEEEA